jgi:hypothetical protein
MFLCAVVTIGFSQLIFMFIYNKLYIKDLINEGYKVKSITKGSTDSIALKLGINLENI